MLMYVHVFWCHLTSPLQVQQLLLYSKQEIRVKAVPASTLKSFVKRVDVRYI